MIEAPTIKRLPLSRLKFAEAQSPTAVLILRSAGRSAKTNKLSCCTHIMATHRHDADDGRRPSSRLQRYLRVRTPLTMWKAIIFMPTAIMPLTTSIL